MAPLAAVGRGAARLLRTDAPRSRRGACGAVLVLARVVPTRSMPGRAGQIAFQAALLADGDIITPFRLRMQASVTSDTPL